MYGLSSAYKVENARRNISIERRKAENIPRTA